MCPTTHDDRIVAVDHFSKNAKSYPAVWRRGNLSVHLDARDLLEPCSGAFEDAGFRLAMRGLTPGCTLRFYVLLEQSFLAGVFRALMLDEFRGNRDDVQESHAHVAAASTDGGNVVDRAQAVGRTIYRHQNSRGSVCRSHTMSCRDANSEPSQRVVRADEPRRCGSKCYDEPKRPPHCDFPARSRALARAFTRPLDGTRCAFSGHFALERHPCTYIDELHGYS